MTFAEYNPCDPQLVSERVATLEKSYESLCVTGSGSQGPAGGVPAALALPLGGGRGRGLGAGTAAPGLGGNRRDLTGLRLLNKHTALRGEMSWPPGAPEAHPGAGPAVSGRGPPWGRAKRPPAPSPSPGAAKAPKRSGLQRPLQAAQPLPVSRRTPTAMEAWLVDAATWCPALELGHDAASTQALARQHRALEEEIRGHRPTLTAEDRRPCRPR